jgi:hypothetical protein
VAADVQQQGMGAKELLGQVLFDPHGSEVPVTPLADPCYMLNEAIPLCV